MINKIIEKILEPSKIYTSNKFTLKIKVRDAIPRKQYLTTENSQLLITEDNKKIITEWGELMNGRR